MWSSVITLCEGVVGLQGMAAAESQVQFIYFYLLNLRKHFSTIKLQKYTMWVEDLYNVDRFMFLWINWMTAKASGFVYLVPNNFTAW